MKNKFIKLIAMPKKLPYGLSDFLRIITDNYYYVDKTRYIELLEQYPDYLFLLRPRRFGKSLFLAMLETYYSIDYAERFDELFGTLYIGQHPTARHNRYMVLRFNFSEVKARPEDVERKFGEYCCMVIRDFVVKYEALLGEAVWDIVNREETDPGQMLSALKQYISRTTCPRIYLLIDEYDNFTNTLLATYGHERYHSVTHGDGFIRSFFNNIKAATSNTGAAVERMFITGVSPVTMDDVTSGFNIGTDISLSPAFNATLGFSEEEVRTMIGYYQAEGVLPPGIAADRLLDEMRPWYDNYCFSEESLDEHVFNSDMVLYCLNSYLFASVLQDVIAQGSTTAELVTSFPAERMADPKNFKSLLYYLGLLAIRDVDFGRTVLNVPNLTVREQLYNHLVEIYREASLFSLDLSKLSDLVKDMALHGAWQPVFRYFAAELERQSAVREFIEGEAHVKGFLLAYLGLTKGYVILPEHESAKGYADFYMMPDLVRQPTVAYSYLVEVKYARREASSSELAALKADAAQQLQRYAEDEKVQRSKGNTQLTLITLIFKGWELVEAEAL